MAYDPHEYDRKRRAEWTRTWDDDYEEVRAESPDMFDEEDDTFAKDGSVVNVQFHNFHDAKVSGVGPIEKCGAIIERLRGNGTQQSDRLPTFGFHRHKLTLSQSGGMLWGAGIMRRLRGTTAHENDVYHFIEEYEVRQSSATAEA
jgi:hypothetical protein